MTDTFHTTYIPEFVFAPAEEIRELARTGAEDEAEALAAKFDRAGRARWAARVRSTVLHGICDASELNLIARQVTTQLRLEYLNSNN